MKTYRPEGLHLAPDTHGSVDLPDDVPLKLYHQAVPLVANCSVRWTWADALLVLSSLSDSMVAVTDVWSGRWAGDEIGFTDNRWTTKRARNEPWAIFARRSRAEAAEYIARHPESHDESVLYEFAFLEERH